MEINVVKSKLEDKKFIADNYSSFDDFWSSSLFEKDNSDSLVLKKDDILIGFICFTDNIDFIEITNIAILKNYRNMGYGKILLQEFLKLCNKDVFLEVCKDNVFAKKLYFSLGFEIISIRKKYYNNEKDAIVMKYTNINSII